MKKLISAALLLAAGMAGAHEFSDEARVLSASPIYERVNAPQRECWTEYREAPARNSGSNIGGTIVGGVVGGILGNQFGRGRGREATTAAGAIAGAVVGSQVQTRGDGSGASERYAVERCENRDHWKRRITGYDVRYEYKGQTYQAMLPNDPGQTLPVRVRMEVTPR